MATEASAIDITTAQAWILRPQSRVPAWIRALLKNPLSIAGLVLIVLFAFTAIFAPLIVSTVEPQVAQMADPTNPTTIPRDGYEDTPKAPNQVHIFGTTQGQYDVFYGVVWGTRIAFLVGILITGSTLIVGMIVGTVSAYYGGLFDEAVQRVVEIFLAFPFLLAAITLAAVLGPKVHNGIITGMIALGVFGWPSYSRIIRGDVLAVKGRDYVLAAQAVGVPDLRLMLRHIIPNSMYTLLVQASLDIGTYVLSFAALSFLGVGAELGYTDWGQMLSFARNWIPNLAVYWWILVYPGIALVLYVLAWNLVGDAFRDALDPKMRGLRAG
jgi:peptide/nickel transport system permease protein